MLNWFKKQPQDRTDRQDTWAFDQGPTVAALTLRSITSKQEPILHVVHDADDHSWQFLTLDVADPAEAVMVSMRSIVALDPSVQEVADLPPGWRAWRSSKQASWQRSRIDDD